MVRQVPTQKIQPPPINNPRHTKTMLGLAAQKRDKFLTARQASMRSQPGDEEHAVEDILGVQISFSPVFVHPVGVSRVCDEACGGINGGSRINLRFHTVDGRIVSKRPEGIPRPKGKRRNRKGAIRCPRRLPH